MKIENAILTIIKKIKTDPDYRKMWMDNIAYAYSTNERWYKQKTGKKTLTRTDTHTIANNAAEHFLLLLCDVHIFPEITTIDN